MQKKIRILAIAPYEAMKDTMIQVASQRNDIELIVEVGTVMQGAQLVLDHNEAEYDVILSRGGTKMEIDKISDKPVYEVPISHLDLLNVIKLVENYQGKIAILAYKNIAESARTLCNIFHYDYNISFITPLHDTKEKVEKLKAEGYSLIIGDAVSTAYARSVGLQAILLVSGRASIEEAFANIVSTASYYARAKEDATFLKALTASQGMNVLVLDQKGNPVFSTVESELKTTTSTCVTLIPNISIDKTLIVHKKLRNGIYMIAASQSVVNNKPYYFFRLQKSKEKTARLSWSKSINIFNQDVFLKNNSEGLTFIQSFSSNFWERCHNIAQSNAPILITGESGLEKEKLACQLYLNSKNANDPLYIVNCARLDEKEVDFLLNNQDSPFYSLQGTIFFKSTQLLSNTLFENLLDGLQHMIGSDYSRFLFTYEINPFNVKNNVDNYRCTNLKDHLGTIEIKLPPLRECIENIPSYSVLYIHQRNKTSATSIVGIEPEAMSMLQAYSWPHNIHQLERILTEAMLSTESPWITAKNIRQLLLAEKQLPISPAFGTTINLKQSLDRIIYDIITLVLNEENMNQSKVAQRLGISRTTLWRYLRKGK